MILQWACLNQIRNGEHALILENRKGEVEVGKIRLLLAIGVVLLAMAIFSPTVHAGEEQTREVGTNLLNVRSEPSYNGPIIGQLEDGDRVVVFQERFGWAQTYYGGKIAWVASHYLIPIDNTKKSAKVAGSGENSVRVIKGPHDLSGKLEGYTVVLDPGHGGKDPGAITKTSVREKNLTMGAAESTAQALREAGADVKLTRSDDTFISLDDRVRISNAHEADAFISLHYNAFPLDGVNGFGTYYYANGAEKELAQNIQSALHQHTDLNSRGIRQNEYHVLRENRDLSVLVELGFMTNAYDLSIIQTEKHEDNVADGIVEGVMEYFHK
ncbi:N-acetylmuramoyl-L-alanine amidase [Lentibacillus lipolyticus]|nr:N-acetylmuramoyl-L-alanine amidase [Lentibacillus lipolyticus]